MQDNVEDIYKLGNRYIALSGIAHLGINHGVVYEVFLEKENKWQARQWIGLPAAPGSSWFVETGDILINTYAGGSILLSETGSIQMAKCK